LGGGLLGLLLAVTLRVSESLMRQPDFYLKSLLMLRAEFVANAVLHGAQAALLQPFLQSGFVVGTVEAAEITGESGIQQGAAKKTCGGIETGVEVNGAKDSFVGVGQEAFLLATSGFFFPRAKA